MKLLQLLKWPSAFFISAMSMILALSGFAAIRRSPEYIPFFDVAVLLVGLVFLTWSIILCWRNIRIIGAGEFFIRRFRRLLLLCALGPFIYFGIVEGGDIISRRMQIYSNAIGQLHSSDVAARLLGSSVRVGWPIDLTADVSSDSGHAELSIPLVGTQKKAELHVNGVKDKGAWSIKDLYLVEEDTKAQIPIAPSSSPGPTPK